MIDVTFAGAASTVTGSKYLVDAGAAPVLVDCGLFQGLKELRLRNWAPPPFDARAVHTVLLTHAHLDHSGYLPLLVRHGFAGFVRSTRPTRDLCEILLRDSGRLLEEEAAYANRHHFSKHAPALPLYTEADAKTALERFLPVELGGPIALGDGVTCEFLPAGHLLGASMIVLRGGGTSVLFSGDVGRPNDPVLPPPTPPPQVDYIVVESTYGARVHDGADARLALAEIVAKTARRGGVVVIPAFCVGRAQEILLFLAELAGRGAIPRVPVYLDSPMAKEATDVYSRYPSEQRLTEDQRVAVREGTVVVRTVTESKRLTAGGGPAVIVAGSGMATGGRVLHHLRAFAPDPKNTVLFVGHQAEGTRGASLVAGARQVRIHGEDVPVAAEVSHLRSLSAHADSNELIDWLRRSPSPPKHTFVTHGELASASALAARIARELGWSASVPAHLERVGLGAQGLTRAQPT